MQVEDYSLGQCIGKGSFGEVYLTTKKGINKLFATKKIPKYKVENPTIKKHLIDEIDEDGNGKIELEEFIKILSTKTAGREQVIKQAFAILDRSSSGYITPNDLRHAMLCLGENYTIEEVNEMISLVDDDQDGVINFQEFCKLIKKCGD